MPVTQFGYLGLEQLYHDESQIQDLQPIWEQALEAIRAYNEALTAFISPFALPTTRAQFRYQLPGTTNYQPLDDKGNPLPVSSMGHFDVGLPLFGAGTAYGDNLVTRAKLTPSAIAHRTLQAVGADLNWIRRHMMAALFAANSYSFTSALTPEDSAITVETLARAATGVEYLKRDGTRATDTHLLAQASTISDTNNPFPSIYEELAEHPSNNVTATQPVVAYIAPNLRASVEGLTSFVPAARMLIREGVDTAVAVPAAEQYGFFGDFLGVVGSAGNSVVVRMWQHMPNDYIIAHAVGAGPVLGWRQFPEPTLQGVIATMQDVDGNYMTMSFRRFAGFGVLNPIAAVVYRIGNATYAAPTGFVAPLAV
jgi:hypothetical protein